MSSLSRQSGQGEVVPPDLRLMVLRLNEDDGSWEQTWVTGLDECPDCHTPGFAEKAYACPVCVGLAKDGRC